MLLIPKGKEPEDYSAWASKVGESSGLGGEMMLSICYSADGETDWVIRGHCQRKTGLSRRDAPCSVFG